MVGGTREHAAACTQWDRAPSMWAYNSTGSRAVRYITLPESTEVHSIDNRVVFAEHWGRSAVAASSVRVSTAPLVLVARDENGQRC